MVGDPTNQPWHIICFLHLNPCLYLLITHSLWIHNAQVDFDCRKKFYCLWKGEKGGKVIVRSYICVEIATVSPAVNVKWLAQWLADTSYSHKLSANQLFSLVSDLCSFTWLIPSRICCMAATQNRNVQLTQHTHPSHLSSSLTTPSQLSSQYHSHQGRMFQKANPKITVS